MNTKIIDKAAWQIDGGVPEETVIRHFQIIFEWLNKKDMLTDEGKEEYEVGIGDCASINARLISPEALKFFIEKYDDYLRAVEYGEDKNAEELEKIYNAYMSGDK